MCEPRKIRIKLLPGPEGPAGPAGPEGPMGPTGPSGGGGGDCRCELIKNWTTGEDIFLTTLGTEGGRHMYGKPGTRFLLSNLADVGTEFPVEPPAEPPVEAPVFLYDVSRGGATVVGSFTTSFVPGLSSHSEGKDTRATGDYSHAEGYLTTASGPYSHAEGVYTTASGPYSHAEGNNTTAGELYSHAEGNGTTASGVASHAEGVFTTAGGFYSHAEGVVTTASGVASHAGGNNVETAQEGVFAIGTNFKSASGAVVPPPPADPNLTYSFQIGAYPSGSSNPPKLVIDAWTGNVYSAGTFNTGAIFSDFAELFEISPRWLADKLPKKDYFCYFVAPDADTGMVVKSPNSESVIGVTSHDAGIILGSGSLEWPQKYLRDDLGDFIMKPSFISPLSSLIDEYHIDRTPIIKSILGGEDSPKMVESFTKLATEKKLVFTLQTAADPEGLYKDILEKLKVIQPKPEKVIDPRYDSSKEYVSRLARPEWIEVGILGRLRVREKVPGSCVGRCDCENGMAVPGTHFLILKRLSERIVQVLFTK